MCNEKILLVVIIANLAQGNCIKMWLEHPSCKIIARLSCLKNKLWVTIFQGFYKSLLSYHELESFLQLGEAKTC